jgi:hemerythrin
MASGIPTVGQQHRQLIEWLNDLLAAMSQERDGAEAGAGLARLDRYADTHFAFEERCMVKYRCPVARINMAAHAYFMKTFGELRAEYEAGGVSPDLALRVERDLAQWFADHNRRIDANLAPCAKRAAA